MSERKEIILIPQIIPLHLMSRLIVVKVLSTSRQNVRVMIQIKNEAKIKYYFDVFNQCQAK